MTAGDVAALLIPLVVIETVAIFLLQKWLKNAWAREADYCRMIDELMAEYDT